MYAKYGSEVISVTVAFVQLMEAGLWESPGVTVVQHEWNNDGKVDQQSL